MFLLLLENLSEGILKTRLYRLRTKIYSNFSQIEEGTPHFKNVREIHTEYLTKAYLEQLPSNEPIVFRGLGQKTDAVKLWSFDFFINNYGSYQMPFWGSSFSEKREYQMLSLKEGIQSMKDGDCSRVLYGGHYDILNIQPKLCDDVGLNKISDTQYWGKKISKIYKFFLSCPKHESPTHSELGHILNFQISGSKNWIILPPSETNKLFPVAGKTVYMGSNLYDSCTKLRSSKLSLEGWEVTVNPGDVLYLPPYYWHGVESLDNSISVAYKWATPLMLLRNPLISAFMLSCRNPNFFQMLFRKNETFKLPSKNYLDKE